MKIYFLSISFANFAVLTFPEDTLRERITGVTVYARAHGRVADNVTVGVRTARADARIPTLLIDTRQVIGTLAVTGAFRSAVGRTADETGQTRAFGSVVARSAQRVRATRIRFAG